MLANVKGTPVVAEAPAGTYTVGGEQVAYDYYRAGGLRVASMTGCRPSWASTNTSSARATRWPGQSEEGEGVLRDNRHRPTPGG